MSDRRRQDIRPARPAITHAVDDARAEFEEDSADEPTRIRRADDPQPRELPPWARELLGSELDHFELLDCIGEGGMGRVFRARDVRLDRLVALKVLNPEFVNDSDMRRRFEQEAKAAARLDSPFFARVYHVGFDKGVCFIAMELVEGRTLRQEIAQNGAVDPAFVLRVGAAIAYGLHHAAQRGVVHRDIKPSNIVVDDDGAVKLIDMGLARDFLQVDGEGTQTNVTMGTLDYISPEQASDPRRVDVRSDIYSLGCTLFHALTGQPPFPEGTDLQKLLSHQNEKAPNPRDVVGDLPVEFAELVMSMMAKRPIDRPQTPAELIHRMQETASALNVAMPTSAPALPPPRAETWWHQQLLWWGPALVLLLGVAIYAMIPGDRDVDPTWSRTATTSGNATETRDRQAKAAETTKRVGVGPVIVVPENADLAAIVRDAPEGAMLQLVGDEYAVSAVAEGDSVRGLLIAKNLGIEPASDKGRVRLRFNPMSLNIAEMKESLALIQVRGAELRLKRLWIEPGVRDRACVGVRVDQGELEVRDCFFDRSVDAMAPAASGSTSIVVNGGRATALDSRFVAGDGVVKTTGAPATVFLWNSLVGPYRRAFSFDAKTDVQVRHSAFLASGEALFTLNSSTSVTLNVEHTVFSATAGAPAELLIDSPKNQPVSASLWRGSGNLYAGGFARRISANGRTLSEDLPKMRGWGFVDELETRTADWPWAVAWETLANPTDEDEIWRPQLALKEGVAAPTSDGLPVGVIPGSGPSVAEEDPAKKKAAANELNRSKGGGWVVDPNQSTNESAGVFATLAEAVRKAPEGKATAVTIARGNGELQERNVKIAGKTIVLRTAAPRAVRLGEPRDMEIGPGALFDVGEGGTLELDGVRLDVFAGKNDPAGAAFVRCSAGGAVDANNATIKVGQGQGAQAMVFYRPSAAGANEGAAPPNLKIRRSDLRCSGSLMAAEPRQPWSVDSSSSRLAAEGPLIRVSGTSSRIAEATANAVKLRQCVSLLGGGLLQLEPSTDVLGEASATPIQFDAEGSLFVAVGSNSAPLIDVAAQGSARMGTDWSASVKWTGDWNAIAGFAALMRLPDSDRAAGMATAGTRSLQFHEWVSAQRLSPTKQHHQISRLAALRSIWDPALPHGKEWLGLLVNAPSSFAEESTFQELP